MLSSPEFLPPKRKLAEKPFRLWHHWRNPTCHVQLHSDHSSSVMMSRPASSLQGGMDL